MRVLVAFAVLACSSSAKQAPPPQPAQGHYVEFGVVEEPGGPPGARDPATDDPQPARSPRPAAGASPASYAGPLVPSKPLKAYTGPEGAVIVMIEVADGKQMLVHFRDIDRELDGTSLLYLHEDRGNGDHDVYIDKKRGSKTYRSAMLVARGGAWEFYHPYKSGVHFYLRYSEVESKQFDIAEVLKTCNPCP